MLLPELRRYAARHAMWQADTRVIAAVSGGSDSVAMLFILHELHRRGELQLDVVAHLNHSIRQEADDDERFCRELANRLNVPFEAVRVDVPALSRERRQSLEVAGRAARRAFLQELCESRGAERVATAHTQDDQAETVLLRVLRGTGRRGLAGILPRRGRFIRPLLFAARNELRHHLHSRGESWREDFTNTDLANPRNRVRHELLPYLERHFNPSARRSLARLADVARADETLLARYAAAAAVQVVEVDAEAVRLDGRALIALPEAIARLVVLHALAQLRQQTSSSVDHVEAVLEVARGRCSAAEVPGLRVEHSGRSVVLVRRDGRRPAVAPFRADLPIPGEIWWHAAGLSVAAEGPYSPADARTPGVQERTEPGAANCSTVVSAEGLGPALLVRSRLPGDRFQPLGLGGRKKLQDVLVDRKVSRTERDNVPIVCDLHGRIVWVAGHVIGEEFRVTDHTNAVIILKLRRI